MFECFNNFLMILQGHLNFHKCANTYERKLMIVYHSSIEFQNWIFYFYKDI